MGAYEYVPPGLPARLYVLSGGRQSAKVSTDFALPLTVRVFDDLGSPVKDVAVSFVAPDTGTSGLFLSNGTNTTGSLSDADGLATSGTFRANSVSGSYVVTATTGTVPAVEFRLNNMTSTYLPLSERVP
jgi:hypothetical protein